MANMVKTYTFVNSQPADATQVNKNFDDVIAGVGDLATLRPTLATLGAAAYSEGTWTPSLHAFDVVGSAPTVSGVYKRIGNIVLITCLINAGSGGNTSVAGVASTSYIDGFATTITGYSTCNITNLAGGTLGIGILSTGGMGLPAFSAQNTTIIITSTHCA